MKSSILKTLTKLLGGKSKIVSSGVAILSLIIMTSMLTDTVGASHSWNNYHWARQNNPFSLKLSSNLSASWQPYLAVSSTDWSASSVIDTKIITGTKYPKTCRPTAGRVEVCNAKFGSNGWLGLAQVWISASHITQGTVKMNDTYMTVAPYNTNEEKTHVMCQEIGHTFGLGHQDVTGAAVGTCMDYSNDIGSQHPNQHDYAELEQIYAHTDSTTTVDTVTTSSAAAEKSDLNNKQNWGRRVFRSRSGLLEVHEREFSDGSKLLTTVTLADR